MIIYNDISGLNASNALSKNIHKAGTPLARVSFCIRINHAADDAAGLSISEKMRGQIRGLMQADKIFRMDLVIWILPIATLAVLIRPRCNGCGSWRYRPPMIP